MSYNFVNVLRDKEMRHPVSFNFFSLTCYILNELCRSTNKYFSHIGIVLNPENLFSNVSFHNILNALMLYITFK